MLIIANSARISRFADIEDSVRGSRIVIEDDVVIDSFVKIKPAGGAGDITIGHHTVINSGCVIYSGNGVTIGPYVAIAANCTLAATNHEYRNANIPIMKQGFMPSRGGISIGEDVWIGANSVLLDGAVVGKGAIIAAGSVVRGELPAYSICAGCPAKIIGWRQSLPGNAAEHK